MLARLRRQCVGVCVCVAVILLEGYLRHIVGTHRCMLLCGYGSLRNNDIGEAGGCAIGEALKVNNSITTIE